MTWAELEKSVRSAACQYDAALNDYVCNAFGVDLRPATAYGIDAILKLLEREQPDSSWAVGFVSKTDEDCDNPAGAWARIWPRTREPVDEDEVYADTPAAALLIALIRFRAEAEVRESARHAT